jgi:hypothetical protein
MCGGRRLGRLQSREGEEGEGREYGEEDGDGDGDVVKGQARAKGQRRMIIG